MRLSKFATGAVTLTAISCFAMVEAAAHFALQSPAAASVQDELGNPQKTAPCGPNGNGTPTGMVTPYAPGETITIDIDEKVFHPGHYRVVLAVNDPSELPAAPPITPGPGDECASTVIDDPPAFPVLADGMLQHSQPFSSPQSFQVTLPSDVTCDNCTLQVIQYMSSHGAPCFYYHCANISIQGDTSGAGGSSSSATGGSGGTGGAGTGVAGMGGAGMGGTGGTDSTGSGVNPGLNDVADDCSCAVVVAARNQYGMFSLFGFGVLLFGTRRRRS